MIDPCPEGNLVMKYHRRCLLWEAETDILLESEYPGKILHQHKVFPQDH